MNDVNIYEVVSSNQLSGHPVNEFILFLVSNWLLLIIESSSCPDGQLEARKSITSLIEWCEC